MMALNAGRSGELSSKMVSMNTPMRRRRPTSKGTIGGFASGKEASLSSSLVSPEMNSDAGIPDNALSFGKSASSGHGSQQQHIPDTSPAPAKPCHSARLALLCAQNAGRLGSRTHLSLCPPGRARRNLQVALRQRTRASRQAFARRVAGSSSETGGYFGLDKMIGSRALEDYDNQEEDFLLSTNSFDVESDEEASSGDEDELVNIDLLLSDDAVALDDEQKYIDLREPLFTIPGTESALSNPNGAPMAGTGSPGAGKPPFNFRKIRFFDAVTATDRMLARSFLTQEYRKCKQRDGALLVRHLRQVQRDERRKARAAKGALVGDRDSAEDDLDDYRPAPLPTGVSQFPHPMTPALSAALILESLALNPNESIEGMAKCYDGIVAAGVALLESEQPTSPLNDGDKSRPSRSEIMAALAPLLITSLEHPSGEVLLQLARLRRMCGTPRYQRRFVQRVVPFLIRPPLTAMWCPRHQRDMAPILAAAELIFDAAFDIFRKGWYEQGQMMLADSKRAETLNTAAMQLRNLSSDSYDEPSLGFAPHSLGLRRATKFITGAKDNSRPSSEPLAEWEVIAVDRQIRISISNIMASDWSRVVVQSRDSDSVRIHRRASATLGGNGNRSRPAFPQGQSTSDASPKATDSSPRSPARARGAKVPMSPLLPAEGMESVFGPSFSAQSSSVPRAPSPDVASLQSHIPRPSSPPVPRRAGIDDEHTSKLPSFGAPHSPLVSRSPKSPPRSPTHSEAGEQAAESIPGGATVSSASPRRGGKTSPPMHLRRDPDGTAANSIPLTSPTPQPLTIEKDRAPLSPSSVGTTGSVSDIVPYRPSSGASLNSPTVSHASHYRTLTSTAAERKRTVAACRALRAQITRFEEAFIQLHGRPPKGAAERAPLATTYAQYREWKRAIRADAACRIQALFRGARTRWTLLRKGDPSVTRVVMNRAGRTIVQLERIGGRGISSENVLKRLSIPVEIGQTESGRSSGLPSIPTNMRGGSSQSHGDSSEMVYISQGQGSQQPVLAPQWSNQIVRRRTGSSDRPPHDSSGSSTPRSFSSPSGSPSSASIPSAGELAQLPLPELQARKRELKQQLKQYDMNFARRHGRMPVKAEKEPIRHLYESYNALKGQITMMEQEGRHLPSPPNLQRPGAVLPSPRAASPPSPVDSSSDESSFALRGSDGSSRTTVQVRNTRQDPPATATAAGSPSSDLAALKAEKGRLHQMLRSYEKDFFKEHKRQVSSFADIKPVASQYRRYKEIKKQIATLQQGGGHGGSESVGGGETG